MASVPTIFDQRLLARRKQRAWLKGAALHVLMQEVSARLVERLTDDIILPFPNVLYLGMPDAGLNGLLQQRAGTASLIAAATFETDATQPVYDEAKLPFPPQSADLIVSFMALQSTNDIPGFLVQCRLLLKERGCFLASFPGGQTLHELRRALQEAETELRGGISPRVHPMVDVKDAGALLQRAGFHLPVADSERITLLYPTLPALIKDLRTMGETAALTQRSGTPLSRPLLARAEAFYREYYGTPDGMLPATFEIITLTGWKS